VKSEISNLSAFSANGLTVLGCAPSRAALLGLLFRFLIFQTALLFRSSLAYTFVMTSEAHLVLRRVDITIAGHFVVGCLFDTFFVDAPKTTKSRFSNAEC
jgi:hypothetical protein